MSNQLALYSGRGQCAAFFTGVYGSYLKTSIRNAGLDPENLPFNHEKTMNFSAVKAGKAKAWKDIWGSGQGIGAIDQVLSTNEFLKKTKY